MFMDNETLEKVLAYVDNHICQKINLCDLSEIAAYSPFYFSKLFSETMGMPVTGYIRIRKLQYAIASLLEGQKVIDVALLYAFDSHEGFTRSFKQLFGSTPSTVRKYLTSYTVPLYVVPAIVNNRRIGMSDGKMCNKNLQHDMHQLVFEFLEQSFEEARTAYCTKITVSLLPDNRIKIGDNGRGLPLDLQASKIVLEKILAGSPITNLEYSQMGDLVQAGLQTVNSLCEALQISVSRNGNKFQQDYIRGVAQHDLEISDLPHVTGTEITLKPDTAIFGDTSFSQKIICDWIEANSKDISNLTVDLSGF